MRRVVNIYNVRHRAIKISSLAISLVLGLGACNKQLDELRPHNVIFEDRQFDTPAGYTKAVMGVYDLLAGGAAYVAGNNYNDMLMYLSEAKGNTIKTLDEEVNRNTDWFNYVNSSNKDRSYTYEFWRGSYKALLHINKVLANVRPDESNPIILQAKAEALFLRSYVYFNLVRLYGKPYYQNPDQSLGVMLVLTDDIGPGYRPERAPVKAVYAQIETDLLASIPLFSQSKSSSYASRWAAEALLSRLYLYQGGPLGTNGNEANEKVLVHANKVILESGKKLLQGNDYKNYYKKDNIGNQEDVFAINTKLRQSSIVGLYAMPRNPNYSGGLYRPSPYLLGLIEPQDLRNAFYEKNVTPGFPDDNIAVSKFMLDFNSFNTTSPFRYLRLAEIYLNRAEALVKLQRDAEALGDLNVIRERAGLAILSGLTGEALFLEILKQRKIELAFEGHSSYDEFRNGLSMTRNYTSGSTAGITVAPTDRNVVMMLPEEEITDNPNLKQN